LLNDLLQPERKADLDNYLWGLEVIDFLLEHRSIHFTPEEFVGLLTKLQPRLYSIASSLKAFPDSVHFTLDVVRYESHGRQRKGVCSTFMAERADDGMPVYPTSSKFRMPEDNDVPMIMVGPGTGIAPFRAFLQERKALGARGKSWLFFGSQQERCDYFYKDEFDALRKDGFSRGSIARSRATRSTRFMCNIACTRVVRSSGSGSRKARTFLSAAMQSAWRKMSTRRCVRSWRKKVASTARKRTSTSSA
jgi:sulfite reductase alpha subunit-like flavoprotein